MGSFSRAGSILPAIRRDIWTRLCTGDPTIRVRLRYADKRLRISCACPYFDDNGECKHLWAAILEADRIGALTLAVAEPDLRVEEDYGERPRLVRAPVPVPQRRRSRRFPPGKSI